MASLGAGPSAAVVGAGPSAAAVGAGPSATVVGLETPWYKIHTAGVSAVFAECQATGVQVPVTEAARRLTLVSAAGRYLVMKEGYLYGIEDGKLYHVGAGHALSQGTRLNAPTLFNAAPGSSRALRMIAFTEMTPLKIVGVRKSWQFMTCSPGRVLLGERLPAEELTVVTGEGATALRARDLFPRADVAYLVHDRYRTDAVCAVFRAGGETFACLVDVPSGRPRAPFRVSRAHPGSRRSLDIRSASFQQGSLLLKMRRGREILGVLRFEVDACGFADPRLAMSAVMVVATGRVSVAWHCDAMYVQDSRRRAAVRVEGPEALVSQVWMESTILRVSEEGRWAGVGTIESPDQTYVHRASRQLPGWETRPWTTAPRVRRLATVLAAVGVAGAMGEAYWGV